VITPRQTRLFSTADLASFERTIVSCLAETTAWDRRASVVIVPSHAAADQLRWTLEQHALGAGGAQVMPRLLTRDELYLELHRRSDAPPVLLSTIEPLVARWSGRASSDSPPRSHTFSLVGPPTVGPDAPPAAVEAAVSPEGLLGRWRPSVGLRRIPVTGLAAVGSAEASDPGGAGPGPVVGRLVHRLLQRAGETGVAADADLESRVVDLMTREERARPDSRGLVVDAATVFRRALSWPEVNGLLQGDCLFEVPFSIVPGCGSRPVPGDQRGWDGRVSVSRRGGRSSPIPSDACQLPTIYRGPTSNSV
jgi:hypothetical protein